MTALLVVPLATVDLQQSSSEELQMVSPSRITVQDYSGCAANSILDLAPFPRHYSFLYAPAFVMPIGLSLKLVRVPTWHLFLGPGHWLRSNMVRRSSFRFFGPSPPPSTRVAKTWEILVSPVSYKFGVHSPPNLSPPSSTPSLISSVFTPYCDMNSTTESTHRGLAQISSVTMWVLVAFAGTHTQSMRWGTG